MLEHHMISYVLHDITLQHILSFIVHPKRPLAPSTPGARQGTLLSDATSDDRSPDSGGFGGCFSINMWELW